MPLDKSREIIIISWLRLNLPFVTHLCSSVRDCGSSINLNVDVLHERGEKEGDKRVTYARIKTTNDNSMRSGRGRLAAGYMRKNC